MVYFPVLSFSPALAEPTAVQPGKQCCQLLAAATREVRGINNELDGFGV